MESYVWQVMATSGLFWCLVLSFTAALCWARLKGAEVLAHMQHKELCDSMNDLLMKVPEARLQELESTISAFRTRIDKSGLENDAYREAVHKSMQRFDQIMRRNERALVGKAGKVLTEEEEDDTPDEIPLGDHQPPSTKKGSRPSRAELRQLLRDKRTP